MFNRLAGECRNGSESKAQSLMQEYIQITCVLNWHFWLGFRVLDRWAGAYREGFESKA